MSSPSHNRGRGRGVSQRHELPPGTPPRPREERAGETPGDAPLGDAEVEPTLDGLLAKLPVELRRQEKKRLDGLADKHKVARAALQSEPLAPLTLDEYEAMIDLVHDPLWGPDDTANIQATSEPLKRFLARKRPLEFDQLWRIVPRIMRCLPVDIMDGRRLTYDADMVSIEGEQIRNPIWPPTFCKSLRVLITHPFFDRCPGLLVMAVQYAVKLRTNDRRQWPLENTIECPFLDDLAAAFASPHPEHSARKIHKGVNQAREGGRPRPLVSVVLRSIEKAVDKSDAVFQGSADPFDSYMVTVTDLRNVARALDNVESCGVNIYLDSDHIFTNVKTAMHSNDLPNKAAGVTRALQKAHLRLAQLAILAERRVAALVNSPAGGSNAEAVVPPAPNPVPLESGLNAGAAVPGPSDPALKAENERLRHLIAEMEEKHRVEVQRLQSELQEARNAVYQNEAPVQMDDEPPLYYSNDTPPGHSDHDTPSPPSSPPLVHLDQVPTDNAENDPITDVVPERLAIVVSYDRRKFRYRPRGH